MLKAGEETSRCHALLNFSGDFVDIGTAGGPKFAGDNEVVYNLIDWYKVSLEQCTSGIDLFQRQWEK